MGALQRQPVLRVSGDIDRRRVEGLGVVAGKAPSRLGALPAGGVTTPVRIHVAGHALHFLERNGHADLPQGGPAGERREAGPLRPMTRCALDLAVPAIESDLEARVHGRGEGARLPAVDPVT